MRASRDRYLNEETMSLFVDDTAKAAILVYEVLRQGEVPAGRSAVAVLPRELVEPFQPPLGNS
jgi:hypothetical protein